MNSYVFYKFHANILTLTTIYSLVQSMFTIILIVRLVFEISLHSNVGLVGLTFSCFVIVSSDFASLTVKRRSIFNLQSIDRQ